VLRCRMLKVGRTNDGFPTPVELKLPIRRVKRRSRLKVYVGLYAKQKGGEDGVKGVRSLNDARRNDTDHEKPSTRASAPHPSVPCLSQPRPLRYHPLTDRESSNRRPGSLRLRFRICKRQSQLLAKRKSNGCYIYSSLSGFEQ
jgi:hypothetical protein